MKQKDKDILNEMFKKWNDSKDIVLKALIENMSKDKRTVELENALHPFMVEQWKKGGLIPKQ